MSASFFVRVTCTPLYERETPPAVLPHNNHHRERSREQQPAEVTSAGGAVTDPNQELLELPIGRKELARIWWNACPRKCGSSMEISNQNYQLDTAASLFHSRPLFCSRYCKPVRKNVGYLSKQILTAVRTENETDCRLAIHPQCKHKDLIHLIPLDNENSKDKKNCKNNNPYKSCYELFIGDPREEKFPWMRFQIELLWPPRSLSKSSSSVEQHRRSSSLSAHTSPRCNRKRPRPKTWCSKSSFSPCSELSPFEVDASYRHTKIGCKRRLFLEETSVLEQKQQIYLLGTGREGSRACQHQRQHQHLPRSNRKTACLVNPTDTSSFYTSSEEAMEKGVQSSDDGTKKKASAVLVTPGTRHTSNRIRYPWDATPALPQKLNFEAHVKKSTKTEDRSRKRQELLLRKGILSPEEAEQAAAETQWNGHGDVGAESPIGTQQIADNPYPSSQYLSLPNPETDSSNDSIRQEDTSMWEATQFFDTPHRKGDSSAATPEHYRNCNLLSMADWQELQTREHCDRKTSAGNSNFRLSVLDLIVAKNSCVQSPNQQVTHVPECKSIWLPPLLQKHTIVKLSNKVSRHSVKTRR